MFDSRTNIPSRRRVKLENASEGYISFLEKAAPSSYLFDDYILCCLCCAQRIPIAAQAIDKPEFSNTMGI